MPLKLTETVHPSDIPRLTTVHLTSFMTGAVMPVVYPKGITDTVRARLEAVHLETLTNDPSARYVVILDTDIPPSSKSVNLGDNARHATEDSRSEAAPTSQQEGEIVAFAEWHIYPTLAAESARDDLEAPAGSSDWPPGETNVTLLNEYSLAQAAARRKYTRGKPVLLLDTIGTDPSYMGRGAASMLMEWGTGLADDNGLECWLEGTPDGLRLYRKFGYREVERFGIDLEKWDEGKGKGVFEHIVMVREPWRENGSGF